MKIYLSDNLLQVVLHCVYKCYECVNYYHMMEQLGYMMTTCTKAGFTFPEVIYDGLIGPYVTESGLLSLVPLPHVEVQTYSLFRPGLF